MQEKHLESCLLVSDPLHMRRGVRMMRDQASLFHLPYQDQCLRLLGLQSGISDPGGGLFDWLSAGREMNPCPPICSPISNPQPEAPSDCVRDISVLIDNLPQWLQICARIKTATVRELRMP